MKSALLYWAPFAAAGVVATLAGLFLIYWLATRCPQVTP